MRDPLGNRDRWRSMSHRQTKRSVGSRKLISLAVMLALVLICIYQLNAPDTFGPVLRALSFASGDQAPHPTQVPTPHASQTTTLP